VELVDFNDWKLLDAIIGKFIIFIFLRIIFFFFTVTISISLFILARKSVRVAS